MIHDSLSNSHLYFKNQSWWKEAIEFINGLDDSSPCGRVELTSGMFASIEEYDTKKREHAHFEAHRKYVDIQVTLLNEEIIEVQPLDGLSVVESYNPEKDIAFFERNTQKGLVYNIVGQFSVLFPEDAHMPGLRGNHERVKKVVVKVPLVLINHES